MSKRTENRRVNIWINGDQAGKTLKELRAESRRLKNEINHLAPGTEEYSRKLKELKGNQKVLDKHYHNVRGLSGAWQKVTQEIRSFGVAALAIMGGQQLLMGMNALIQRNAQLDDSFTDVMKTTGMTKEAVKDLYKDLGSIHTRNSRKELLNLAKEAGKLGITGHKNIRDFVEAANQIDVSLGEDLGDGAITALGKLNQQFKITEVEGYKEGLLKTGSAINDLGAKSSANEAYLVDFTKRMAGASAQAKISIADTLGWASALDNLGLRAEMSSTSLSQTMIDMFSDASTYAQIAGKSTEEFNRILEEDANAAFKLFLAGLQGNNEGMTRMVKKFEELGIGGARQVSVLASLAGNLQLVDEQQRIANEAFAQGSSLTEEFGIKNESAMAKVERIGRAIRSAFINSSFVEVLEAGVDILDRWLKIPLENKIRDEQAELNHLVVQIQLANTNQQRRNKLIAELESKYPGFLQHLDAETVSNEQLHQRLQEVNEQYVQRIVLARQKEKLEAQAEDTADVLERELEKREAVAASVAELNQLLEKAGRGNWQFSILPHENELEAAKRIREELQALVSQDEGFKKGDGSRWAMILDEQTRKMQSQAAMVGKINKEYKEEMEILGGLETEYGRMEEQLGLLMSQQEARHQQQVTGIIPNLKAKIAALEEERAKLEESSQAYKDLTGQIEHWKATLASMGGDAGGKSTGGGGSVVEKTAEEAEKLKKEAEEAAKELEKLQAKIAELTQESYLASKEAGEREVLEIYAKYDQLLIAAEGHEKEYQQLIDLRNAEVARKEAEIRERLIEEEEKKAAARLETEQRTQQALAKIRQLEAGTPEEELEALINHLETERDIKLANEELLQEERTALILEYEQQINDARARHAEAEQARQEESLNAVIGAVSTVGDAISMQYQARINDIESEKEAALASLERRHEAGTLSDEEYYQKKEELEERFSSRVGALRAKQAKAEKQFAIFEATINAAMAVVQALATIPPPFGAIAALAIGAKTAAEISLIKSEPIPQYAEGGFTSFAKGGWVSSPSMAIAGEAGPEWIAPNWMLRNPATANIIGALEGMRSGQVPAYAEGGFTSNTVTNHYTTTSTSDPVLHALVRELSQDIKQLKYVQAVISDRVVSDLMERAEFIQKVKDTGEL